MSTETKKKLKIYRGTLAEIMSPEIVTEDMAIYLAWDTREIYVGNKLGVKVLYNGGENFTARQVRTFINEETASILDEIRNLLTQTNINYITIDKKVEDIETVVSNFNSTLTSIIQNKVNEVMSEYEDESLGDLYFNKIEVASLVSSNNQALIELIDVVRKNTYTKLEIETLLPPTNNVLDRSEFDTFKEEIQQYSSVKKITSPLTENLLNSLTDGIYFFKNSKYLIIKDSGKVSRINSSGIFQSYNDGVWANSIDPTTVLSINNQFCSSNNNVILTADNIDDTSSRKWNSLIPNLDGSINILGRDSSFSVGINSVAIGAQSYASGEKGVAYGYNSRNAAANSIQIGDGYNATEKSMQVWNHKLLDQETGFIPQERLGFLQETISINPYEWDSLTKECYVEIEGIEETSLVWVSPNSINSSNFLAYIEFEIRAIEQFKNILIFQCSSVPNLTISVNVLWRI